MCSFQFYLLIFLEIHIIQNGYVHQIKDKKQTYCKEEESKIITTHQSPAKVTVHQKKGKLFFLELFFISSSTNIQYPFSSKKTNISISTDPILNFCSDDVQTKDNKDKDDNNRSIKHFFILDISK